jgi:hypothetical protein
VKEIKDIVLASLNPDFAIGFEKNGLNL